MFKKWLHLIGLIQDAKGNADKIACPSCDFSGCVDFQYVGDLESRIGYLDVWCTKCNHGIHMSRVQAPEGFPMLPFGSDNETIASRIPNFMRVEPMSVVSE